MFLDRKEDHLALRWAFEVKKRDNFTCVICGRRGIELNSHHLYAWNKYEDLRYDLDNGVSLCVHHHEDFHHRFGFGDNTKEQFDEYSEVVQIMYSTAMFEVEVERATRLASKAIDGYELAIKILGDIENGRV